MFKTEIFKLISPRTRSTVNESLFDDIDKLREIVNAHPEFLTDPRCAVLYDACVLKPKCEVLEELFEIGFRGNIDVSFSTCINEHGQTLLHNIVTCCFNPDVVEFLLKHGADPNKKDLRGNTPLHCAIRDVDAVKLLMKYGADVNALNFSGYTPLKCAIILSQIADTSETIKLFLSLNVPLIHYMDALDYILKHKIPTPKSFFKVNNDMFDEEQHLNWSEKSLLSSIKSNMYDVAFMLMKESSENIKDEKILYSALTLSVDRNNEKLFDEILKITDVNKFNPETAAVHPFIIATKFPSNQYYANELIKRMDYDVITEIFAHNYFILIKNNCNRLYHLDCFKNVHLLFTKNVRTADTTFLHECADGRYLNAIKQLAPKFANDRDQYGRLPLHRTSDIECIKELVKYSDICSQDDYGRTILHNHFYNEDVLPIVRLGALLFTKDLYGLTPVDYHGDVLQDRANLLLMFGFSTYGRATSRDVRFYISQFVVRL